MKKISFAFLRSPKFRYGSLSTALLCAMAAPIMQLVTEHDSLEDAFLRATSQE